MPLPKRVIEPVFVARSVYERNELPGDLETVTNTTLTNIMRQLSSLARHSEDLFGELARETNNMADRANSLQTRIDRLSIKVTQLDSEVKEVSLKDINKKKAFKSATQFDQDIFSRATMPTAMLETYQTCDKPPPLDKLNCYRDDGKDGLKFYTDPNYFFDLWRQDILQETERKMNDRYKQKHKPKAESTSIGGNQKRQNKRVRQPTNTREKQRQIAIGHGETLMPQNVIYRTPNAIMTNQNEIPVYSSTDYYDGRPNRPNSIELRRSYPSENATDGHYAPASPHYQQQNSYQDDNLYNSSMYGQQQQAESPYGPGTPSRGGKIRPTQPPPAPPSSGSGGGTPNASNANTPTRGRSMSTGRDVLPPPPPIPELSPPHMPQSNGGILRHPGRTSMGMQRGESPQRAAQHDLNNHVMTQLNSQINNININDLPPPPPIPEQYQMSPKSTFSPPKSSSPPNAPPPAPPMAPPPPALPNGNLSNGMKNNIMSPPMMGGLLKEIETGISLRKVEVQKDRGNSYGNQGDLMKEIRDGIKLRKVEQMREEIRHQSKSNLHDVASILARRVAIELSDSDCSDSDDSDEEWMDGTANETSA